MAVHLPVGWVLGGPLPHRLGCYQHVSGAMSKTSNFLAKLNSGTSKKAMVQTSNMVLVLQPISERITFLNQQHTMMVNGTGQECYGPMIAVLTQQSLISTDTVQDVWETDRKK